MLKNCASDFGDFGDLYDFYGNYDFDAHIPQELLVQIMNGLLTFALVVLGLAVMFYVFTCVGMHTMAKRRGIRKGWLAWLPFGSSWILGSISDQYQYVAKGRIRNRRKVLLGLEITIAVLSTAVSVVENGFVGNWFGELDAQLALTLTAVVAASSVLQTVLAIIFMVFEYIALYDLYHSSDPDNSVVFLVLSIFLGFLQPFLIFASRKKELGMPPRKPVAPVPNTWQPFVEPVPAWQPPVTTAQPVPDWQPPVQSAAEPVAEEPAPEKPAPEEQTEE